MTLHRGSSLRAVTAAVGNAIRRHGIRGVVTGGSCASLHSDGVYQSQDIDGDENVRPVEIVIGRARFLALSPTDSCRDRLAQFFHWKDRQSLSVAVLIAVRRRVDLRRVRAWSSAEGFEEQYEEFLRGLRAARRGKALRSRP